MGITFSGEEINVNNHKKTLSYAHTIKINKNSKLYNIFKTNNIKVNSRHKSVIKKTRLNVVGISNDGYIEAIEDTSKRFFIGVQWHPESMIDYDIKQKNLFKYFIKTINIINYSLPIFFRFIRFPMLLAQFPEIHEHIPFFRTFFKFLGRHIFPLIKWCFFIHI